MRPYAAILGARFRLLLQYRAAALAGFATQLFWGLIRVMIFEAFYASTAAPQPMTLGEVVSYVWLGQALLTLMPWNFEEGMRELIRTGNVAYELLRPVDLYGAWFSRTVAFRSAPVILRSLPMFVIAGLFFGLQAPASAAALAAFLLSVLMAVMLSAAITTLLWIGLLWTISGEGIARLSFAAIIVLSGNVVPLPLFPDALRPLIDLLPFRGVGDVPFRIYIGHIPLAGVPAALLHQLVWTVALVAAGRALLARGLRKLVVQGG